MDQPHHLGEAGQDCTVGACNSDDTIAPIYTYPAPETVCGRVLGALLSGEQLTSNVVLFRFSASRLSAEIHRLREAGWPVLTEMIEVQTRDHGRRSRIALYLLDPEIITAAGERGRQFVQACRSAYHGQEEG